MGFPPPLAVEVGRGLLDQRHAFAEHRLECIESGEPAAERHRLKVRYPECNLGSLFTHTPHTLTCPASEHLYEGSASIAPVIGVPSSTAIDSTSHARHRNLPRNGGQPRPTTKREPREAALRKFKQGGVKQSGQSHSKI